MENAVRITASHITYLLICKRKLWLYAKGMEMEHFSDQVLEGRLIHQYAYPRRSQEYVEVQLDGIKIDFFDARARVVHETKRGRAIESAHIAQVQYYLYKLHQHGITGASGLIEYPDLRKTQKVLPLDEDMLCIISNWEVEVKQIIALPDCPVVDKKPYCRQCAFHDLCYITEP